MSDSVVFASPFPGALVPAACGGIGCTVTVGAGAGAGVGAAGTAAVGGGTEGARVAETVGVIGFVELGRFVQASSSKPLDAAGATGAADAALWGVRSGGGEADLIGDNTCGELVL